MIATVISDINYAGTNGKETDLAENVTLEYVVDVSFWIQIYTNMKLPNFVSLNNTNIRIYQTHN